MKTNLFFWSFLALLICNISFSQQLVINEVSQGPAGAQEYVELLVTGTPTCNAIPCMDLRNYIIDDNNGNHANGSGTGIASGCIRLQNIAFWSCIPIGTIILIYNDADPNPSVPAADLSMTDGNCRLIIPISNCTLLERHTSQPSTGTAIYPTSGYNGCGNWNQVAMANSDDSFQTISATGSLLHSVSWGNNNLAPIIYFAGGAGGKVAVMNNSVDNNPANQANWSMVNVAGNETPGSANNTANGNWINSMNNSCSPLVAFSGVTTSSNTGCVCNGSATLTASGAIGPYTYTWLPSGGNSNTATGLCSGIYTVSSTSSNGCTQTKTVNIASVGSLSLTINSTSIACNGSSNGSATVTANGGSPAYSYTWSPAGGNASTASGLAPGTYTVFVKDAGSCTGVATVNIAQPATALSATLSSTNILCFNTATGSASVIASGGTPGYSYTWSPAGGNNATANGLTAGTYTVVIKDANNCAVTKTTTISQPPTGLTSTIASTNILCFGAATGVASVIANGGTPGYSYTWTPSGGNGLTASGLTAGTYTVLVKDSQSCTATSTVTISQPSSALTAIVSSTNILCFGAGSGAVNVTVNGGTPGYSYTWSPAGGNAPNANNLAAGIYTAAIKDANNCVAVATTTITQPLSALTAVMSSTNILCFGNANGMAHIIANGGTPSYSYSWSPAGGNTSTANGLAPGTYTVLIKDAGNCTTTATTTITQPSSSLSASITSGSIKCFGGNTSATVTTNGGTPGYSYSWLPFGGNLSTVSGIGSGNYSVTVKDQNNCTLILSLSINQPNPIGFSVNSLTLCSGQPATLTSTISGGTSPFSYNWNGTITALSSFPVSSTATTIYTITATDANGCISPAQQATVNVAGALSLAVTSNYSICSGDKAVLTSTVNGGTGNYSYLWQPGSMNGPTQVLFPVTHSQTYTLTVNDGCSSAITRTVSVFTFPVPVSDIRSSVNKGCSPLCVTFSDSALLNSGLVQTYHWSFGSNEQSNLSSPEQCYRQAGNYPVMLSFVTINGCVGSQTLTDYVHVDPTPVAEFTSDKTEIDMYNPTIHFNNQSSNANEYTWYFGDEGHSVETDPSFTFVKEEDEFVFLMAKNEFGCVSTITKEIKYKTDFTFFAPNVFTQNNDHLNDVFLPMGMGWNTDKFEMTIYNRWGAKIFSTKKYDEGWDGRVAGAAHKAQSDEYVWKVTLYDINGKYHEFMGHVLVENDSDN